MEFQSNDYQDLNDIDELEKHLSSYKEQLGQINSDDKQGVESKNGILQYAKERALRFVIQEIERRIREIKASKRVNQIENNIAQASQDINNPDLLNPIKIDIEELKNLIEENKNDSLINLADSINPKLSVLRPNVKLVDANLAYKYADLQGDFNILLSFTTLFIGVGISSSISVGIEKSNNSKNDAIVIHSTVLVMSILFSVILGILTFRAYKKSNKTKIELETDSELNEIK